MREAAEAAAAAVLAGGKVALLFGGGLLVHCSAQRKRFLWDRGYIQGLFKG